MSSSPCSLALLTAIEQALQDHDQARVQKVDAFLAHFNLNALLYAPV